MTKNTSEGIQGMTGSSKQAAAEISTTVALARKPWAWLVIFGFAFAIGGTARAQDRSSSAGSTSASFAQGAPSESTSKTAGDYSVTQSIEFGGRDSDIHGSINNYDTFEDLNSGVRLFDYTVDMNSKDHKGVFFDNLNFTNSGYGGDPNEISHLRIDKSNLYDFRAMFRRDLNYFNYNLLGNPLNPTTGPQPAANAGIYNSPQLLDLSRKMQNYDLTLFPQGHFRIRAGFSRNTDTGLGADTVEGGTEPFLTETFHEVTNSYRVGLDYRGLPKTTLSYDELLTDTYIKNSVSDRSLGVFQLANGQPVDIGIVSVGTTPCSAASITSPTVSSTCNAYTMYSQVNNPHSAFPVGRFSFQSSYFKNLVTSGSVSYSESRNNLPGFSEDIAGWSSRTLAAGSTAGGPAWAHRVSTSANLSGEYSVTEKLALTDQFFYDDWRIPSEWATANTNIFDEANPAANTGMLRIPFFPTPANLTNFATLCPIPFTAVVCPQHSGSSGADVTDEIAAQFLSQNRRSNTFEVKYDFTRRVSAYLGYEFTARTIQDFAATWDTGELYLPGGAGGTPGATQPGGTATGNYYFAARGDCAVVAGALPAACTLNPNGSIVEGSPASPVAEASNDTSRNDYEIHENAGVFGIAARPMDTLRLNADFLLGYNDNAFTRISPRQVQGYRVHGHYTPKSWASVDASADINENRDNVLSVNNIEHDRTYGAVVTLSPKSAFWADLGYNYVDIYTQTYACFVDNGSTIFTAANSPCTIAASVASGVTLGTLSTYVSHDNFVFADTMYKPVKRVTLSAGYSGSIVRGSTTFLNPLTPTGTLDFTYLKPFVSVAFDLYKGLSYKTAWNFYGYDTHGPGTINPVGLVPLPSQNFNGSNITFSLRYVY